MPILAFFGIFYTVVGIILIVSIFAGRGGLERFEAGVVFLGLGYLLLRIERTRSRVCDRPDRWIDP
jgi:hypothetical protein